MKTVRGKICFQAKRQIHPKARFILPAKMLTCSKYELPVTCSLNCFYVLNEFSLHFIFWGSPCNTYGTDEIIQNLPVSCVISCGLS